MATKLENLPLQIAHFNRIQRYLGTEFLCQRTIKWLLREGMIEVSTAFEKAIERVGQIRLVSKDAYDFADYSDAKLSSVRTCSYGTVYSAPVNSFHGKIGLLRVQVYERKKDQFYYFVIPNAAYSQISPKSTIELRFELDGTPMRQPRRRRRINFWDYEVQSFEEMACSRRSNYTR